MFSMDRRKFLNGVKSGAAFTVSNINSGFWQSLGGVLAGAAILKGPEIVSTIMSSDTDEKYDSKTIDLAGQIFFGFGERLSVVPAYFNPNDTSTIFDGHRMTKPTQYASSRLQKLLGNLPVRSERENEQTGLVGQRVIFLGSPASNKWTKDLFGARGKSILFDEKKDGVQLQFLVFFDQAVDDFGKPMKRKRFPGDQGADLYCLGIVDDRLGKSSVMLPEIRNDKLVSDFLVVTSIPAIQSLEDFLEERRLIRASDGR